MKKDEIIELLKEQIKRLRDDNNRLLGQVDALIKEVSSLKEALLQKGESLSKQQRLAKGLAKLVSNTSEQQQAPQPAMSEEERQKREAEKADKRKARKNNGAKRDMHYEMEEEEHVVYPDDPDFDINKARLFTTAPRICVRYECVPMRFCLLLSLLSVNSLVHSPVSGLNKPIPLWVASSKFPLYGIIFRIISLINVFFWPGTCL